MRLERFRRTNERTNEINEMYQVEERREEGEQSEYEEDWEDDEEPITRFGVKQINKDKSFKSDYCIICLTNLPNVLFCNCGHMCDECDKIKTLIVCPVCKTENTIKRTV